MTDGAQNSFLPGIPAQIPKLSHLPKRSSARYSADDLSARGVDVKFTVRLENKRVRLTFVFNVYEFQYSIPRSFGFMYVF